MILAAGFGSRLGTLSQHRPKPMLPVAGLPLVRWAVLWLRHHGIEKMVVNLHHLGEQIEAELGNGSALDVEIQYSRENGQILGTGGGLRQARPWLDDGDDAPIVIVNGKILLDLDLSDVLTRHRAAGAEATMVLRPDPEARTWGSFRLDETGRIAEFLGASPKTPGTKDPVSAPLMFTGVHVVQPRFLERIPPEGEQCIIRTAYRELFHEGRGLFGDVTEGYWAEHSTPARYLDGVAAVLSGRVSLPFAPHPLAGIHESARVAEDAKIVPPVWIDRDAVIESKAVVGPLVQVGRNARVATGVSISRSIVWDTVAVTHDLEDGIATPDGVVRRS